MKLFLLKSAVICLLYIFLQTVFYSNTKLFFGITAPFISVIENKEKTLADVEIITLGSSIEYMKHPKDVDKRTMTQRLQDYLPDFKITAFSQPGYTIDILNPLLRYISGEVHKEKLFIVEFNWDQFSVKSNKKNMDRTLDRLLYENNYSTSFFRPLSIFNYNYGVLSDQEFELQEVFFEDKYVGQLEELQNEENYDLMLRNLYMIKYMYSLSDKDKRVKAFKDLISYSVKNKLKILIYLTPFDYKSCNEYFTDLQCKSTIDGNILFIKNILEEKNIPYVDLSKSLSVEHISTSERFPNGHLKSEGRDFIARELAKWIKTNYSVIYPKQQVSLE